MATRWSALSCELPSCSAMCRALRQRGGAQAAKRGRFMDTALRTGVWSVVGHRRKQRLGDRSKTAPEIGLWTPDVVVRRKESVSSFGPRFYLVRFDIIWLTKLFARLALMGMIVRHDGCATAWFVWNGLEVRARHSHHLTSSLVRVLLPRKCRRILEPLWWYRTSWSEAPIQATTRNSDVFPPIQQI